MKKGTYTVNVVEPYADKEQSGMNNRSDDTEFETIFRNLPVAIVEIDADGNIQKSNPKASALFNYKETSLATKNFSEFLQENDKPLVNILVGELRKSESDELDSFELGFLPFEKDKIITRITTTYRVLPDKKTERLLLVIEDITAQKEEQFAFERYFEELQVTRDDLEERTHDLAQLNEKLRQSEIELEEINKNKDKFFSLISHDLRSPFTSLLGLTKLIHEDFDNFSREEIKESIYNLHQVSEGMYNLIEDLLDWSRIQFNRFTYEKDRFNLSEQTASLITSLKSTARDKNISVVNVIPRDLEINADPHMITTILRNLVNNSIKFTPKYGLIKISASREPEFTFITVEDNGIGMTHEKVKNLFKVGTKSSTPGTEGEAGTGLGLVLCKEFIEKHDGEIWVDSEKDKGSKFTFTIPN